MTIPWWVVPQSAALAIVHFYLWWRLVRNTTVRRRKLGTIVIILLWASIPAALITMHVWDPSVAGWFAYPGFGWYALMIHLTLLLVPAEPVRAVIHRRSAPVDAARRLVLARGIAVAAGIAATGVTAYGVINAFAAPAVERETVHLRRLSVSGFRIAVLSDVHLGVMLGKSHTQRIVDVVNAENPDLIAIVGDLVDGTVQQLGPEAEPLRGLRSKHGTYFVTGNHEYISGVEAWVQELNRLGIRTLRNERVELPGFDLAGTNDLTGEAADVGKTLGGRNTNRPVVLLAHQPVHVHDAAKHGVDLQLSGHTHGGQFVPVNFFTRMEQPMLSGLQTFDGTQLFVTRGAGFWGPPVRVGSSPEIAIVELVATARE
ncbi:metallophosphoesterase [Kibdelosporangium philippinense]|uniref:Metallophosphoesterase n=1 Tax=Kibdelosporangium philippinense TaxID=211113 RepID=A0ABS8ZKK4_9PSEU|nr:metallophosphoesterase [Kibdelosporangium philippinense]MCE7006327.1 metallophosphoesterase [Kibdelosporangium philippinense]